jgi:hypothetical protein
MALEAENQSLKNLLAKFEVLNSEDLSEILGLLRRANPRVRSLTHTLLKYGALSPEEIDQQEKDQGLVVQTLRSTINNS